LRLCAQFFFFYSRKGAKPQRNSDPLGLTSGGLGGFATLRPPRRIFSLLFSQKPAYRQAGHRVLPAKVGAKKY
jgi:hypothetical protein